MIQARAVIVATGTRPRVPDIAGLSSLPDGSVIYGVAGAKEILSAADSIMIIGGGEAAFDYALSCAVRFNLKVTLLIRSQQPRARGWLRDKVLSSSTIRVVTGMQVTSVSHTSHGVQAIIEPSLKKPYISSSYSKNKSNTPVTVLHADVILPATGRIPELPEISVPDGSNLESLSCLHIIGDARLGSLGQATAAAGEGLLAAMEVSRCLNSE